MPEEYKPRHEAGPFLNPHYPALTVRRKIENEVLDRNAWFHLHGGRASRDPMLIGAHRRD